MNLVAIFQEDDRIRLGGRCVVTGREHAVVVPGEETPEDVKRWFQEAIRDL